MREQVLERKTIGEYRYEVFFDNYYELDIDFEHEEEEKEFIDQMNRGLINAYGVVKSKVCQCCCLWSETDSLWGMLFETPQEALEDYLKYHEDQCLSFYKSFSEAK